ncbi:MAG: hypothetical protein EOO46_01870 [Flavobacterium sp.]|nr:MAG: hypothetical protein EOO46_01870 [Flavobacterium sp.]
MEPAYRIAKLFSDEFGIVSSTETLDRFQVIFSCPGIKTPALTELAILKTSCGKDGVNLNIKVNEEEPAYWSSAATSFDEFTKSLSTSCRQFENGDVAYIEIIVNKVLDDKFLTIYSLDTFAEFVNTQTVVGLISHLDSYLKKSEQLFLINDTIESISASNRFGFVKSPSSEVGKSEFEITKRKKKSDTIKTYCSCNLVEYDVLPEDLRFKNEAGPHHKLLDALNRICFLESLGYLFDICEFNGQLVDFKLNGYKSIYGTNTINNLKGHESSVYYDIYEWVYTGGNTTDKIGLARNIISLHIEPTNVFTITGKPFHSILSGFKIYEQQNIKQYIEIRNKISDQLLAFNERASKIIEVFASGFQKSSLAVVTFYVSTIALKILGKGDNNVFTTDSTLIAVGFLFACLVYFFVARWEVKEQRKRFIASYKNMKLRYQDLLNEDDIDRILNKDKDFNEDVEFIRKKLIAYSAMWFVFILVFLIITLILFSLSAFASLKNTIACFC